MPMMATVSPLRMPLRANTFMAQANGSAGNGCAAKAGGQQNRGAGRRRVVLGIAGVGQHGDTIAQAAYPALHCLVVQYAPRLRGQVGREAAGTRTMDALPTPADSNRRRRSLRRAPGFHSSQRRYRHVLYFHLLRADKHGGFHRGRHAVPTDRRIHTGVRLSGQGLVKRGVVHRRNKPWLSPYTVSPRCASSRLACSTESTALWPPNQPTSSVRPSSNETLG